MNKRFGFFKDRLPKGEPVSPWDPNIEVVNVSTITVPDSDVAYGVNFEITSNIISSLNDPIQSYPRIFVEVIGPDINEMYFNTLSSETFFNFNGNANVTVLFKPSSNVESNTNVLINLRTGGPDADIFYTQSAVLENHTNIIATGGNVTTLENGDILHEFTANSTFNHTDGVALFDYLIVAGGGGGGIGGGGGGGVFLSPQQRFQDGQGLIQTPREPLNIFTPTAHTVTIGTGGIPEDIANGIFPTNGGNTSIFSIATTGGGAGGARLPLNEPQTFLRRGSDGGSGGGGGFTTEGDNFNLVAGSGGISLFLDLTPKANILVNQGFVGGATLRDGNNRAAGGGGGGSGGGGQNGQRSPFFPFTVTPGVGGSGKLITITDTPTYYSGGGGGAGVGGGPISIPRDNGLGGGPENFGGGGQGMGILSPSDLTTPGLQNHGGSGVVYVRYGPYGKKLVLL